jgi:hypothetical protein
MTESAPVAPVGYAVIRTRTVDGLRAVVWQWSSDAPPHYREDESWRKFYPETEHYSYALHAIEGTPVPEDAES